MTPLERIAARIPRLAVDAAVASWFTLLSTVLIFGPMVRGYEVRIGWDAVVYTRAAQQLLAGGDPWTAEVYGIVYAAPPPSLLPYLPFVWLPDAAVAPLWLAIGVVSSVYAVWKLRLPGWWLLFPPLLFGVVAGSSAPLLLALLVRGGVFADAAAIATRIYAAAPVALLGRWRGLVAGAVLIVATAPFLGMGQYLARLPEIEATIERQAGDGFSALTGPFPALAALVALVLLGRRRAAWLIVPALWPSTQIYYASIALPVLAEMPLVAYALGTPVGGLAAIGLVGQALWFLLTRPREQAWRTWLPARLERAWDERARARRAARASRASEGPG